jgi:hypothetical protein
VPWFTIRVSNHPQAHERPAPQAAVDSWQTVFDGEALARNVLAEVNRIYARYACTQVFKGKALGKLWHERLSPVRIRS